MVTKKAALGKGINELFTKDDEIKPEVISDNLKVRSPKVRSNNLTLKSYNLEVMRNVIDEAEKNPRISLWSLYRHLY